VQEMRRLALYVTHAHHMLCACCLMLALLMLYPASLDVLQCPFA
jgi:hypothetical protein